MKHLPIFDSSSHKKPLHNGLQGGYSMDSFYTTPPKQPIFSQNTTNTLNKPPLNSKFIQIEHLSKQTFKPPPNYHLGDAVDVVSPFYIEKKTEKPLIFEKNEKTSKNEKLYKNEKIAGKVDILYKYENKPIDKINNFTEKYNKNEFYDRNEKLNDKYEKFEILEKPEKLEKCDKKQTIIDKPPHTMSKTSSNYYNNANTNSLTTRKMSSNSGKTESFFTITCPDCHHSINLLDAKSSKNQPLEEYLRDLSKFNKKPENNESFISATGVISSGVVEFEGKDPHIDQKYGKYLKKNNNYNNDNPSIMDSPLASRNILTSNKKNSVTMIDYYYQSNGKNHQDESFLSVDRKKEDRLKEIEVKEHKKIDDIKNQGISQLNEKINELNETIKEQQEEIRKLNDFNIKLMENLNVLMKIKAL